MDHARMMMMSEELLNRLSDMMRDPTYTALGRDTVHDDPRVRELFLTGRIHHCLDRWLGPYDVPESELDTRDPEITITNTVSGRKYRITVEEIKDGDS